MLSKLDMLAEKEPPVGTDDAEMPPTEKPGGASVLRALMCQCFVGDFWPPSQQKIPLDVC